jgi:hypothetical protein
MVVPGPAGGNNGLNALRRKAVQVRFLVPPVKIIM